MAKRIALFNHKGDVSRTVTIFNLGWMLASKGKKVILADTDPQCNLTELVLGYNGLTEFERFYETEKERNLRFGLAPTFEAWPTRIKAVDCIPIDHQEGLFLLPGHIRLSEYEVTLGMAQQLSGSAIYTLRNLPGSIAHLLEETAKKFNADYVLIDMNPSLNPFNQNLLMTSHFFIVPTTPDYFSAMAIDSLSDIIPYWHAWAEKAQSLPTLRKAVYPLPSITPKFLGTIIQNYLPRSGTSSSNFQKWIDKTNKIVSERLVPGLDKLNMMLPRQAYEEQEVEAEFCLVTIPDFNTLIAQSQKFQTPVFALTPEQIEQAGVVLETMIKSCDNFKEIFSKLADKIIGLINYASSD